MAKYAKKKDKFEDLPEDWRSSMAGSASDDSRINEEIRRTALYAVRMEELKAEDQDLAVAKETSRVAGQVYRDAKKEARLKTEFLRDILKGRGRSLPGD